MTSEQGVERTCHYCGGPIPDDEKAIQARTKNAWAHFECWYDGAPFKRDPLGVMTAVAGAFTPKEADGV